MLGFFSGHDLSCGVDNDHSIPDAISVLLQVQDKLRRQPKPFDGTSIIAARIAKRVAIHSSAPHQIIRKHAKSRAFALGKLKRCEQAPKVIDIRIGESCVWKLGEILLRLRYCRQLKQSTKPRRKRCLLWRQRLSSRTIRASDNENREKEGQQEFHISANASGLPRREPGVAWKMDASTGVVQ